MVGGPDVTGAIINATDNVVRRANTASYVVWFDGTLYHADNMLGGADVTPSTDAATVIQACINILATSGGVIFIKAGIYNITTQITITNNIGLIIKGEGSGTGWTATQSGTVLNWTGTTNNVPMILVGQPILYPSNPASPTSTSFEMTDIFLDYNSTSTGNDGIKFQAETANRLSSVFYVDLTRVSILHFPASNVHVVGLSAFDLVFDHVLTRRAGGDGFLVDDDPGVGQSIVSAGKITCFGCDFLEGGFPSDNTKYAVHFKDAAFITMFGGAISGYNGLLVESPNHAIPSIDLYGVNIESVTEVPATSGTGVYYKNGLGLRLMHCYIYTWTTGIQIGTTGSASVAERWEIDCRFYQNTTDILITSGGSRKGILGPLSVQETPIILNNRFTTDAVQDLRSAILGGHIDPFTNNAWDLGTLTAFMRNAYVYNLTIKNQGAGANPTTVSSFGTQKIQFVQHLASQLQLIAGGAFAMQGVVTKTTTYSINNTTDSVILADATGGAFTVTLPGANGFKGEVVTVKKVDSSANTVTVSRAGADTIEGATTKSLAAQNNSITLISDGTSTWYVLATT